MRGHILIVDDDRSTCELLEESLSRSKFDVTWRTSAAEALELLNESDFDTVVTDLNMPGVDGLELCDRIAGSRENLPVVVITAYGSLDTAVAAIRAGAYDFVTKPFEKEALILALDRAVQHRQLKEEVRRLRETVGEISSATALLGESDAMKSLRALIIRVAKADTSVLISGETGTGKELVARELHNRSHRHAGPFIGINCAAMPETLLESELFGHIRGAFTDARSDHVGLLVQANGGTLLLDEIGAMPLGLQSKVLRALQERKVRPVGSNSEVDFDVRIVSASNVDLENAVDEGRFRQDLFFRINVIYIEVPPLRARGSDILLLAQHFIKSFSKRMNREVHGVNHSAAEKLQSFSWPGNVRELQNCIERAIALATHELITVEDLPEKIRSHRPSHLFLAGDDPRDLIPLAELERRYIFKVLEAAQDSKTEAARILGLDRKTLYRKLEQYKR
ncbi:MAG: sigma-54 dependent transcriptional regulator [bacterium]